MRLHASEQPSDITRLRGASAEQAVAAEQPEVARLGYRDCRDDFRRHWQR